MRKLGLAILFGSMLVGYGSTALAKGVGVCGGTPNGGQGNHFGWVHHFLGR